MPEHARQSDIEDARLGSLDRKGRPQALHDGRCV
jgi:hypothetical protein